jgi:hypothetical protein
MFLHGQPKTCKALTGTSLNMPVVALGTGGELHKKGWQGGGCS